MLCSCRLLFACFPLPAAAILTWAGVAIGGAAYAAPCLAVVMYAAVGLYAVPLRSGLGGGGAGGVSAIGVLILLSLLRLQGSAYPSQPLQEHCSI